MLKGAIANVNTTINQAQEKGAALAYRGDYSFGEYSGVGFAGLHGKAPNFTTGTNTTAHLFEVDGYYTRGDWTYQGQVGIGSHKKGAIALDANGELQNAKWWGLSGLAGYLVTPQLQALLRADYIKNSKNGGGLFGYSAQGRPQRPGHRPDGRLRHRPDARGLQPAAPTATR